MQSFDIVKSSAIETTYRVARIMGDFDVKAEHSKEHFQGEINMPENWHIGVIVGGSGTGKSSFYLPCSKGFVSLAVSRKFYGRKPGK